MKSVSIGEYKFLSFTQLVKVNDNSLNIIRGIS